MAELNVHIDHRLPQQEATQRIKGLLADLRGQYAGTIGDVDETWTDDYYATFSFKVMGSRACAALHVDPVRVRVVATIPWTIERFKDRIESTIQQRVSGLLRS